MYMGEKEMYYARVREAHNAPGEVASFNTDGMNQSHSKIPYLANLCQFKKPYGQHIQGVLEQVTSLLHIDLLKIYRKTKTWRFIVF